MPLAAHAAVAATMHYGWRASELGDGLASILQVRPLACISHSATFLFLYFLAMLVSLGCGR